jgi:hypothetical protein
MSEGTLKLVRYVCTAEAHAEGRSGSGVTIHEGEWAYCPSGYDVGDHEWEATDGLPDHLLMRFSPRPPAATARPGPDDGSR